MLANAIDILVTRDTLLDDLVLSDAEVDALVAFMEALTDPETDFLPESIPGAVPSGLPVRASIGVGRQRR